MSIADLTESTGQFAQLEDRWFREVILEKVKIAAQTAVSRDCLADAQLDVLTDHAANGLILRLSAYVLAMPRERIRINRRWPADWLQAVKARWFPNWALRRWPVKYESIDVDEPRFGNLCPHVRTADNKTHFRFLTECPCAN